MHIQAREWLQTASELARSFLLADRNCKSSYCYSPKFVFVEVWPIFTAKARAICPHCYMRTDRSRHRQLQTFRLSPLFVFSSSEISNSSKPNSTRWLSSLR